MSSGSRVTLVALLLVGAAVAGLALLATGPIAAQDAPQVGDPDAESLTTNSTLLIDLDADGDAHWTISTVMDLETEYEREAFAELAQQFERGEVEQLGLETYRLASAEASRATDRPMELTDPRLRASSESQIDNGTGRLQLEFTWTNFAVRNNDTLRMGDVFNTTGGTWLPELGANQRLLIKPPEGGGVIDANVPARGDGTLVWEGPRDLDPDLLSATFTVRDTAGSGFPVLWVLALTLLSAGVVIVYVAARFRGRLPDPGDAIPTDPRSGDADEPAEPEPAGGEETAAAESDAAADEVDVELLSDEERVERLLEQNGGRMKQANIVTETGWSNAKVSQLLSAMEEDGQIDKLRIGRENLISFPDEDITGEE